MEDHLVADDPRRGLDRRQIAAGVGLRVALRPADLAARDLRQVLAALVLGAELEQRGADHREPEADQRQRQVEAAQLVEQDLGVRLVEPAAAVRLGPGRRGQPALGEDLAVALRPGMRQLGRAAAPVITAGRWRAAEQRGQRVLDQLDQLGANCARSCSVVVIGSAT
jgi:hypothetical protein